MTSGNYQPGPENCIWHSSERGHKFYPQENGSRTREILAALAVKPLNFGVEKEGQMTKGVEYRKHAQECRALARNVQNEGHKLQLLKMAEAWDSFAVERERVEQTRMLTNPI